MKRMEYLLNPYLDLSFDQDPCGERIFPSFHIFQMQRDGFAEEVWFCDVVLYLLIQYIKYLFISCPHLDLGIGNDTTIPCLELVI